MRAADRDAIAALVPGQSLTVDGVEVKRTPEGDLQYLVNLQLDGRRIYKLLGYASRGFGYADARAYVEQRRIEAREHRLLLPKGRQPLLTFRRAAAQYLAVLDETGGRGISRKRQQLTQHLIPALGDIVLADLSVTRLLGYRRQREAAGASPKTANRELAVVSHLLTVACDERWIAHKPCRVPKVAEERIERDILTPVEQEALLRAAIDNSEFLFVPVCRLRLEHGHEAFRNFGGALRPGRSCGPAPDGAEREGGRAPAAADGRALCPHPPRAGHGQR